MPISELFSKNDTWLCYLPKFFVYLLWNSLKHDLNSTLSLHSAQTRVQKLVPEVTH